MFVVFPPPILLFFFTFDMIHIVIVSKIATLVGRDMRPTVEYKAEDECNGPHCCYCDNSFGGPVEQHSSRCNKNATIVKCDVELEDSIGQNH